MAVDVDRKTDGSVHISPEGGSLTSYVRPADVIKATRVSKTVVMEAIWSGRLEAYRVGRAWLIPAEAVDRWIRGENPRAA